MLAEPKEEADDKSDYSELYEALGTLKKEYRLTIVLYYLEGYSIEEIGKIMRVPPELLKPPEPWRRELRCIMATGDYEGGRI